jgi:aminoglycoside 6'-N-acetyltransferase I
MADSGTAEQITRIDDLPDGAVDLYTSVFNDEPWKEEWSRKTARRRLDELVSMPGFIGYTLVRGTDSRVEITGVLMDYTRTWSSGSVFVLGELYIEAEQQGEGRGYDCSGVWRRS